MTLASAIEPRAIRWLWRERVPTGALTLMGGRPSGGKGLLTMTMIADVSQTRKVILLAGEDPSREVLRPRLDAAGANLVNVDIHRRMRFPEELGHLEQLIKNSGAALVVIDPMASFLGDGISRYTETIRRVSDPLADIAEDTETAIVIVDHVLKNVSAKAHPLMAFGGSSSGLPAAARCAYIAGKDPSDADRLIMVCVKPYGPDKRAIAFEVDGRTFWDKDGIEGSAGYATAQDGEFDFDAHRLLVIGEANKPVPPEKRSQAAEFLCRYLYLAPGHQAKYGDLVADAGRAGIKDKTLKRAKDELCILSKQRQREWWWVLPQELIAEMDESEAEADGDG